MKFQVARQDFDKALKMVAPTLGTADGDLESHFTFRRYKEPNVPEVTPAEGYGSMEVMTYNGRSNSSAPFKVKFLDASADVFSIEGKRLQLMLANLHSKVETLNLDYGRSTGEIETTITFDGHALKKQYFQPLDTKNFPYFDGILAAMTKTAELSAARLHTALEVAQIFNAEETAKNQSFCVTEVRNGILTSSNKTTVCMVTLPELKNSKLRIYTKDTTPVLHFLKQFEETDTVETLEHEQKYFFRRKSDNSMTGGSRFHESFQNMGAAPSGDEYIWKLSIKDLRECVKCCKAGSKRDDMKLELSRPIQDGPLLVAMDNTNGKTKGQFDVDFLDAKANPEAKPFPSRILVSQDNLERMLAAANDDVIEFAASNYKSSGFFRYRMTKHADAQGKGDDYEVMVVWTGK